MTNVKYCSAVRVAFFECSGVIVRGARRWSNGGMILTGEEEGLAENSVLMPLCTPEISRGVT
jgi:hypothetical protein